MSEDCLSIKEEFDNNFKILEDKAKKKSQFLNTSLIILGICLFISVLLGTLLSYNNYVKAKERQNNKVQVIEFKNID